ncbi:MAG: PPC domain-containing protein [Sumerlaeia bacterium]
MTTSFTRLVACCAALALAGTALAQVPASPRRQKPDPAAKRATSIPLCGMHLVKPKMRPLFADTTAFKGTPIAEAEPNNIPANATPTPLGRGVSQTLTVSVSGVMTVTPSSNTPITTSEENGSIPTATNTGLSSSNEGQVTVTSDIGVLPATGDFDHYRVSAVAGQTITAETTTPASGLDTIIDLYDSSGNLLASNDDRGIGDTDSIVTWPVTADGDYYISVTGYPTLQLDPFDPNSGDGPPDTTGTYNLVIDLSTSDLDLFAVDVAAGDLLSVRINNGSAAGQISVFDSAGTLRASTTENVVSFSPPPLTAPVLQGGTVTFSQIIETAGTYYVGFSVGEGAYTADIQVGYPGAIDAPLGTEQILFLDFDGATINAAALFGSGSSNAVMSPLSSFLTGWGLAPSEESDLIDAIIAVVEENLIDDLRDSGLNGDYATTGIPGEFALTILNSRDDPDPFGQPNVSRVIVGGTIAETGVPTVGIAESIDVGNFYRAETAIVLLDNLSDPDTDNPNSANAYGVQAPYTKIQAVAQVVGNIVAHEAGHYFGCWHTDQFNVQPELMDQGGNPVNTFGPGPDQTFGTPDDVDVDFGIDVFNGDEGVYFGNENNLSAIIFGLSTGADGNPGVIPSTADSSFWQLY